MSAASTLPTGLTILIVDDDMPIVELWRSVLSEASPGLCVITAPDGIEALRLARERRPDVVLMDLAMPGMDGLAATRALKADLQTARIPVIAVTGRLYGSQRVLDAGCDGYMIKPVSPAELVQGIARALRHSAHAVMEQRVPRPG